jgi:hypothetical protein
VFRSNDRQVYHMLIIVVVSIVSILALGFYSYSSSALALSLPSVISHHKISDKKQDSDGRDGISSSRTDTKSSSYNNGNSDNNEDNNKNNNQGTNGGSNTGTDNTFQAAEPTKSGEQQQEGGENIATSVIDRSETTCEQGSNCTDQQGLTDRDRSTTDSATNQDDNTPFVLSLPFP